METVFLGTTYPFSVLAGSGITFAGAVNSTTIDGDIGTFPTTTITGIGNAVIAGTNHAGDAVTQAAKLALVTAYNDAAGRVVTDTIATQLGGQTLLEGVYDSADGTFGITGTLTLDGGGNPDSVFIFQMATTLTTAGASNVVLINGAQEGNVFWRVGSSATLGTTSHLVGSILALTSITMTTGATIDGRTLARNGAVTMDENVFQAAELDAGTAIEQEFPTCTLDAFANGAACYRPFQAAERGAILIYYMAAELAALGGPDFTAGLGSGGTLANAAACLRALPDNPYYPPSVYSLFTAFNSAVAAGATVASTPAELSVAIACLKNFPSAEMAAMMLALSCYLTVTTPP